MSGGDIGECSILKGILQNGSAYNYPGILATNR